MRLEKIYPNIYTDFADFDLSIWQTFKFRDFWARVSNFFIDFDAPWKDLSEYILRFCWYRPFYFTNFQIPRVFTHFWVYFRRFRMIFVVCVDFWWNIFISSCSAKNLDSNPPISFSMVTVFDRFSQNDPVFGRFRMKMRGLWEVFEYVNYIKNILKMSSNSITHFCAILCSYLAISGLIIPISEFWGGLQLRRIFQKKLCDFLNTKMIQSSTTLLMLRNYSWLNSFYSDLGV